MNRSNKELDGLRGSEKTWSEIYHYSPPRTVSRDTSETLGTIFLVIVIVVIGIWFWNNVINYKQ